LKASVLFLAGFLLAAVFILAFKAQSFSLATGSAVMQGKEAYLTVEALYFYVILVALAVIVCAIIWYFNRLFDREESSQKQRGKKRGFQKHE